MSRYFVAVAECQYKTSGVDLSLYNILGSNIYNTGIYKLGQLRLFKDLVFYYRLNIFLFLLLAVLLLDIFCRAIVEVVSSIFFRDNILTTGPGITDFYDKVPNFYFNLCLLDLVSLSLQLLSLLLEDNDFRIREKYYKNIVRYVYQCSRIIYKAYINKYTEDIIYGKLFENNRLNIKRYSFINISLIIYYRVRIIFYNLILNYIYNIT